MIDGDCPTGAPTLERAVDVAVRERWSAEDVQLYVGHWDRLVRLAALLLDDVAASEDVVQEAFVRLALRPRRGAVDSPIAYLTRIVVNLSRSALRRRLVALRSAPAAPDHEPGAEAAAIGAFERSEILGLLRRLPRRQREAVALRYYGELTMEEMAVSMGVAVGTAKSTLSRATAALGDLIGEDR